MATTRVNISFFQPIDRDRTPSGSNVLHALYDAIVDDVLSSPLASKSVKVQEIEFQNKKRRFQVIEMQSDFPLGRLGYLCAKVTVVYGLVYHRRPTCIALTVGFALKYYVRSNEEYTRLEQQQRRSFPVRVISEAKRKENLLKWMQKWKCDNYFRLFAFGMTEESIIPAVSVDDSKVRVYIGEASHEFPRSMLLQLPFFNALMGSGMRDVHADGIHLTEAFPFSLADLQKLQLKLESSDASKWGSLEAFDFLCVGMRSAESPAVQGLGALQTAISSQDPAAMNPYLQNTSNSHLSFPPGAKVGYYSFNFLPSIDKVDQLKTYLGVEDRVRETVAAIQYIVNCTHFNPALKHYYCNKVIQEFLEFLHGIRGDEINHFNCFLRVLDEAPKVRQYLTILSLPYTVSLKDHCLPVLLKELPNLLWLQLDLFDGKLIVEDDLLGDETYREKLHSIQYFGGPTALEVLNGEVELPKDLSDPHSAVRILSIENQDFTPGQKRALERLFPNADIIEIQVKKVEGF